MRTHTPPPQLRDGPFTARSASAFQLSRSMLRSSAYRQLWRGVYAVAELELTMGVWLAAARLIVPIDAVVCGLSACTMWGIDVRATDDVTVHVAVERNRVPRKRRGIQCRELELRSDEVVGRNQWLVTTPIRTAFDCARWLTLVEGVVVVEALTHAGLVTLSELADFAARHPRTRWLSKVADVIQHAEPLSESPMESRLRMLLVLANLPRPRAQLVIGHYRVDLVYEAQRVVVEYDGSEHWKQRRADDRRRAELRALGWNVLVFSAEDYLYPHRVVAEVASALRKAAA